MIKTVVAKNFKGRDLDVEIGPKTLIVGPNGTGKSAIVQALELALNGNVSGGAHKTNQGILEAFGGGDKLTVEVGINGEGLTRVGRQFARDGKGQVSQMYLVDRRRADAKAFAATVATSGGPRVVVVDEILALTPLKLISYLASFVGDADIENLQAQITATSNRLNQARAKLKESEGYISRTMAGIAGLNLPAGSLAEVQAEIKSVEADLSKAKRSLREAEKAEAERLAALEAEKEALAKQIADAEKKATQPPAQRRMDDIPASLEGELGGMPPTQRTLYPVGKEHIGTPEPERPYYYKLDPIESIERIIKAIVEFDCPTCGNSVVLMTAKAELAKWKTEKRRNR